MSAGVVGYYHQRRWCVLAFASLTKRSVWSDRDIRIGDTELREKHLHTQKKCSKDNFAERLVVR